MISASTVTTTSTAAATVNSFAASELLDLQGIRFKLQIRQIVHTR